MSGTIPPISPGSVDEAAARALVAAFEDLSLPFEVWRHHATHLTVALWYIRRFPHDEAMDRIRSGIQRLNGVNGVLQTPTGGYHETITRVYVHLIRHHLAQREPAIPFADVQRTLCEAWGDQSRLFEFYSKERLRSWEARTGWVEPDVAPLPALPAG